MVTLTRELVTIAPAVSMGLWGTACLPNTRKVSKIGRASCGHKQGITLAASEVKRY